MERGRGGGEVGGREGLNKRLQWRRWSSDKVEREEWKGTCEGRMGSRGGKGSSGEEWDQGEERGVVGKNGIKGREGE